MEDIMTITPLGSGQEVGRSCHLLTFNNTSLLLDCGIHPGYTGVDGLPFFDRIEPSEVDILLITHFHLDHAASLPYFTERTGFRGRIFMTHPTKAVIRLLLYDYLRLMDINSSKKVPSSFSSSGDTEGDDNVLYTEAELKKCVSRIELIDYHSSITVGSCTFTAYNAGHVLGACMYVIELGGRRVLYTGDYSMEDDRHLMKGEIPDVKPDVLIVEATYGVQVHASREEREARFTGVIDRVVSRGGKCLIPVFALGRAQELLLILDEYWQANKHLHNIPVYYASKLASKALRVYQTYINMMNAHIRTQMDFGNPFQFKYIKNLKTIDVNSSEFTLDDSEACVVFASPGMLQSGVSRRLFDRWCSDSKNGVIIAGYAVDNTLAKELMSEPDEVMSLDGKRMQLNCLVDYVSFSAHVDFVQNRDFISRVDAKHVILVHGQKNEMGRLKGALQSFYSKLPVDKRPTISMPPNATPVRLSFSRRRQAKVMGQLAKNNTTKEGDTLTGILFTQNFKSRIVAPEEIGTYTQLRVGKVKAKVHVPFCGSLRTVRLFFNEMFGNVVEEVREKEKVERVGDENGDADMENDNNDDEDTDVITTFSLHSASLTLTHGESSNLITLQWEATPVGDMLADSAIALIMHAQSSAASIRISSVPCNHGDGGEVKKKEKGKEKEKEEEAGTEKTETETESSTNTDGRNKKRTKYLDGADVSKLTPNEIRLRMAKMLLDAQFKEVEVDYTIGAFHITCERNAAKEEISVDVSITFDEAGEDGKSAGCKIRVMCEDEGQGESVRECLRQLSEAVSPIYL